MKPTVRHATILTLMLAGAMTALAQVPTPTPEPPATPPATPPVQQPAAAPAASSGPTVRITAQVRERSEIDGRSFTRGASPDVVHYLRSRLGVAAAIDSNLGGLIEVQDARAFGQTRSTLNIGAPAFDLRQAWVDIRNIGGAPLSVKVGRQAIAYNYERLIGRIDWRNDGQSFDGAVATLGLGDVSVDFLGLAIARNPNTTRYNRDVILTGAWGQWTPKESPVAIQACMLYDNPRSDSIRRQNRYTAALFSNGGAEGFDYEVEGAYQFGKHIQEGESPHTSDISASMVGARIGYTMKELASLRIGVGYDRLSGSEPTDVDTYGSFNTLYGTNHKYYGLMDYFINIPLHTKGMGLQDMMVNISVVPLKKVKLSVDAHLFMLAVDPAGLSTIADPPGRDIGKELDVTVAYAPTKALNLTCGYSVFDGDPERLVLTGSRTTTQWGYAMLTVGF